MPIAFKTYVLEQGSPKAAAAQHAVYDVQQSGVTERRTSAGHQGYRASLAQTTLPGGGGFRT